MPYELGIAALNQLAIRDKFIVFVSMVCHKDFLIRIPGLVQIEKFPINFRLFLGCNLNMPLSTMGSIGGPVCCMWPGGLVWDAIPV